MGSSSYQCLVLSFLHLVWQRVANLPDLHTLFSDLLFLAPLSCTFSRGKRCTSCLASLGTLLPGWPSWGLSLDLLGCFQFVWVDFYLSSQRTSTSCRCRPCTFCRIDQFVLQSKKLVDLNWKLTLILITILAEETATVSHVYANLVKA